MEHMSAVATKTKASSLNRLIKNHTNIFDSEAKNKI